MDTRDLSVRIPKSTIGVCLERGWHEIDLDFVNFMVSVFSKSRTAAQPLDYAKSGEQNV